MNPKSSYEEAQDRAEALVRLYELGPVPAEGLVEFIEQKVGVHVLFLDVPPGTAVSGAFCQLNGLGAILVNRGEAEGRRNYDLAHELFHALTWDLMEPEHRESCAMEERAKCRRIEQLADTFAAALLMPSATLEVLIDPERREDVTHLADVAARLGVTRRALGWRLFNLRWIRDTTREALNHERTERATANIPGPPTSPCATPPGSLSCCTGRSAAAACPLARPPGPWT